jgi:DNA-binding SARP family transcriptional activator
VRYTGVVPETLRVRLLGGLDVEGVPAAAFGSRKARLLVKVLAVQRGRPVHADALAEALWGDDPPAAPGAQLAVLVSRVRTALGPERVQRSDAGYALAADWLDVDALDQLADEAEQRLAAGSTTAARTAAAAALTLVRGPLLADEPDADWCAAARAASARTVSRVRHVAAAAALAAGDPNAAIEPAEAALADDAYDEVALRQLVTAHALAGRPATAVSAYERFRDRLDSELGIRPSPATEQTYLAVLREEIAAPPTAPGVRRPDRQLPGRDKELAALDDALDRAAAAVQIVLVQGEAGIGKTALLETWAAGAAATGVHVLHGRCDELGRDLPLEPILAALAAYLRARGANDVDRVLGGAAVLLGPLLGRAGDDQGHPDMATMPQTVLFAALLDVVSRLAAERPVAVVIDDLHLADAATLGWLAFLRRRGAAAAVVVVATCRMEEPVRLPAPTLLILEPLDFSAAVEVVGADAAARVYDRSGGSPLFLVELAAAGPDELPASVRDAVLARVEQAGPAASTLRAAAVLGPEVDLDLLTAVTGEPSVTVLDHLEDGVRRRLLDERGGAFVYRHVVVREALAASLSGTRQALLHRVAARTLAGRADADPLRLAHHARAATDNPLAAEALGRASLLATARYDHAEAVRLLDVAVALADSPALRRLRARALLRLARYADATADAEAALATEPVAESYDVAAEAAYYDSKDFVRAAALATTASRLAEDPAAAVRSLAFAGRALHARGDLADAAQAFAAARAHGVPVAALDTWEGAFHMHLGDAPRAIPLLTSAVGSDDALAFAPVIGSMQLGLARAIHGDPIGALADFERTERLAREHGLVRYAGRTENCRAYVLRNLGRLAEADEWNVRGSEGGRSVDQPEPQAHALLDRADGHLERLELDAAADLLDRAAEFAGIPHTYAWRHVLRTDLLRARLALLAGQYAEAQAAAAAVVAFAERNGVERYLVLGRLARESARRLAGEPAAPDLIAADLTRLPSVAGLDAWRVTADVAEAFGSAKWRRLADDRVEALARAGGELGDALRAYARTRAESTRIAGRAG